MERLTDKYEDNWDKISIKNAEYILNEGKQYMKHMTEVNSRITNRAFAILAVLIPLFTLSSNFWISKFYDNLLLFKILLVLNFSLFVFVIIKLAIIVKPFMTMPQGSEPKRITDIKELMGIDYDHNDSYLILTLYEIDDIQTKIEFNDQVVSKRHKSLSQCIDIIGIIFFLFITITLIYIF